MNTLDSPVFGSKILRTVPAPKSITSRSLVSGLKPSPSMCGRSSGGFVMGTCLTCLPFGLKTNSEAGPVGSFGVLKPNVET